MSIMLVFPHAVEAIKISIDGENELVQFKQFESVMIVKENNLLANRSRILTPPRIPVTEVILKDGSKLLFEKPFYLVEE